MLFYRRILKPDDASPGRLGKSECLLTSKFLTGPNLWTESLKDGESIIGRCRLHGILQQGPGLAEVVVTCGHTRLHGIRAPKMDSAGSLVSRPCSKQSDLGALDPCAIAIAQLASS